MLFNKEAELIIWVVSAVGLFDVALILDLWGENKKDTWEKMSIMLVKF